MIGATSGGVLPLHWSKLTKRACVQAELAQNFQPSNGLIAADTSRPLLATSPARSVVVVLTGTNTLPLDDIVERYGPLRPAVPELLLGAGFVETRAGQLQRAWRK